MEGKSENKSVGKDIKSKWRYYFVKNVYYEERYITEFKLNRILKKTGTKREYAI